MSGYAYSYPGTAGAPGGIHVYILSYTSLTEMFKSILNSVRQNGWFVFPCDSAEMKAIGFPHDPPDLQVVGFRLEEKAWPKILQWYWRISLEDLEKYLATTPESAHLRRDFQTAEGRARIARILSRGERP